MQREGAGAVSASPDERIETEKRQVRGAESALSRVFDWLEVCVGD